MQIAFDVRSLNTGGTGDSTYLRGLVKALATANPDDHVRRHAADVIITRAGS